MTTVLLRRIASLLLLICMALPLSNCKGLSAPEGGKAPVVSVLSAGSLIESAAIETPQPLLDRIAMGGMVLCIFVLPALLLLAPVLWQGLLTLAVAVPSMYVLFAWVFVLSSEPMIGGWLAAGAWIVLVGVSIAQLAAIYRARTLRQAGVSPPA